MKIDTTHNKILKETISESFIRGINEDLVPKLSALFGSSMLGIQMYEDYLGDDFLKDGYRYYPLTVVTESSNITCWIKWDVSRASDFEGGNPYCFVGDNIEFIIADDVPIAFGNALSGRSTYYSNGSVKLNVSLAAKDVMLLRGKYSQTFVDEMARQLTQAIERALGVSGLSESSIELDVFFAPDTYMEHTSENVTYRRLLMSAKGCAPRDFWVKWTRLNSAVAYSLTDNVTSADVVFEIGEDVPHKIREKEYRFLVYSNSDKYRMAMGRKNITEWRELIKRAVKRGELEKSALGCETEEHAAEVSDKLAEILQKCGVSVPVVNVSSDITDNTAVADEALRSAVLGNNATASDEDFEFDTEYPQVEFDIDGKSDESAADASVTETVAAAPVPNDTVINDTAPDSNATDNTVTEEPVMQIFEEKPDISADVKSSDNVSADSLQDSTEDILTLMLEIEKLEAKLAQEADKYSRLAEEKVLADKRLDVAINANNELSSKNEQLVAEISELRRMNSEQENAKNAALAEVAEAKDELLRIEDEKATLLDEIDTLKRRLEATEEESRRNEEKLRNQLELEEKERVRDKLLFAEAARLAREESERLAKEKAEAEARAREESARLEAERMAELERKRAEEERLAEIQRIENEMREQALRRENALARAKEIRLRMEKEARMSTEAKYGALPTAAESMSDGETGSDEKSFAADDEQLEPAIDFSVEDTIASDAAQAVSATPITEQAPVSDTVPTTVPEAKEADSAVAEAPKSAPVSQKAPVYTYTSKIVRMLFRTAVDESVTSRIRELIAEAIKKFGKERVYIKMKATVPDSTTVILDILQIPEEEIQLLIDIIHHLGNSNIGIYKVIME